MSWETEQTEFKSPSSFTNLSTESPVGRERERERERFQVFHKTKYPTHARIQLRYVLTSTHLAAAS